MLTSERARAIVQGASQWPYWGNYQKFMAPHEVEHVRALFTAAENGNVSFASIVHRTARVDMFSAPPNFDDRDAETAREYLKAWNLREGPRVGDWVRMPDGTERRFTHDWGDALQTTCGDGDAGSFYFGKGFLSYSGALDPSISKALLSNAGEFKNGRAWFFHHNSSGAGRGVYFTLPCRVYVQKAVR